MSFILLKNFLIIYDTDCFADNFISYFYVPFLISSITSKCSLNVNKFYLYVIMQECLCFIWSICIVQLSLLSAYCVVVMESCVNAVFFGYVILINLL
jgi:hypothetical protein